MFMFGPEWQGYTKSAVFWQDKSQRYEVLLDDSDSCDIPWEAQSKDGFMFVGALGRKENITVATKILVVPINEGTKAGSNISDPSPDAITQMLAILSQITDSANEAKDAAQALSYRLPYINDYGNWMLFDVEANAYADSGISAMGDMTRVVYDNDCNGAVDNADALGGIPAASYVTNQVLATFNYATQSYVNQQIAAQITGALEGSY